MEEISLNKNWHHHQVPLKLKLGDKTLFTHKLWLQVREVGLDDDTPPVRKPTPPSDFLHGNSQGFLVRSMRVVDEQPVLQMQQNYISYIPSQYLRYYIDMQQSFAEYKNKFSSKTRSTLNRKIKNIQNIVTAESHGRYTSQLRKCLSSLTAPELFRK